MIRVGGDRLRAASGLLLGDDLVAQIQARTADGDRPDCHQALLAGLPVAAEAAGATWGGAWGQVLAWATQTSQM